MKRTTLLFLACLLAINLFSQSEVTSYLYLEDKNGEVEAILFTNGTMTIIGNVMLIGTQEEFLEYDYDEIERFYFKFLIPCQEYYMDTAYWNELGVTGAPQTVNVRAEPSNYGTVTGSEPHGCGEEITVTATPNTGRRFVNWTENIEGVDVVVSTEAAYSFTVTGEHDLVAHFENESYTITLDDNPPNAAEALTGAGIYDYETWVEVTAEPNDCYIFKNWTKEDSTVVSTNPNYTFEVTEDGTLTANFEIKVYAVQLFAAPGGTVEGGGMHDCGGVITVTAIPNHCYLFKNWTENGVVVSTDAEYQFEVTVSRMLIAHFEMAIYTVVPTANPVEGGAVGNGGNYFCDSLVTVVATPEECYDFINWTEEGVEVSTDSVYTFEVTENRNLVANFERRVYNVAVSANLPYGGYFSIDPPDYGDILFSGGMDIYCGESVTVVATPLPCYEFVEWTKNGTTVSTESSFTFIVTELSELVAHFTLKNGNIILLADPEGGGAFFVNGEPYIAGTIYPCNTPLQVRVTANDCYIFTGWSDDEGWSFDDEIFSFQVSGDRTLTAHFAVKTYDITVLANLPDVGTVEIEGGGTNRNCGDSITITATPEYCWKFIHWAIDDEWISDDASYTFHVANSQTLTANFAPKEPYDVIVSANPPDGGTVTGGGNHNCDEVVELLATPSECYRFVNWSSGGEELSTDNPYFLAPISDTTLMANFEKIPYTITVTETSNGTVSPNGEPENGIIDVSCGDEMTFNFIPDECYHIAEVLIDGINDSTAITNGYYTFENITENHHISVSFAINIYTVTPLATDGGTIFPDMPQTLECGENRTFTATPNDCLEVDQWIVNGVVVQEGGTSYTVFNIQENTTVSVAFKTIVHTIMATCGANGSIAPNGLITVWCNNDQTITFVPDECYRIAQVWIDGQPDSDAAENGFYTFENVTEPHTIHVTFAANNFYLITATCSTNGTITPDGEVPVLCRGSQRFDFYPDEYYRIEQVWIDDVENFEAVATGYYTFENVTEPHTIHVVFALNAHTITATAGSNGTITPNGIITVIHGTSKTFEFAPDDPCYEIDQVLIDGVNDPDAVASGTYTFENIESDHTISVSFKIRAINITATSGNNGTIIPDGETSVICGVDKTFVFQPDECYHIAQVRIDGVENPDAVVNGYYIFLNITEEHSISVSFAINTYIVTPLTTNGGTIFPNTPQTVACGENRTFTATPGNCREVDQWIVNGVVVQEGGTSYTVLDIRENTTVSVTFKTITYTIMATCGANGSIDPDGLITVWCGNDQTFFFMPDECYRIAQVWVDGLPDLDAVENGFYTFENITENHTIHVTFVANGFYTITAEVIGENGSINPDGVVPVLCTGSQRFDFYPDECYEIEQVWIDGVENSDAVTNRFYTFENVTGNHTISVSFKLRSITITATSGDGGAILSSGELTVNCGSSITFMAIPDDCHDVGKWIVNGVEIHEGGISYTLSNVQENTTIEVTFKRKSYTIQPTVINGNVTPSGVQAVECGDDVTFCFTPNPNYEIDQVYVDGELQELTGGCYTFYNVTGNHTIFVTYNAVGITENMLQDLFIYPNPAKDKFYIKSELEVNKVELYSITGALLLSDNYDSGKISIATLPKGVYLLKVYTNEGLRVGKVVKE